MSRRNPLILLELLAAGTAALSVLAGVAFFLLAMGPIRLDFLTPYIESALSPAGGPVKVRIDSTKLTWEGWQRPVDVRAEGVRILSPTWAPLATLDAVSIGLSIRGLLRGLVAPTSLEIRTPTVRLTRTHDGRIEFGLGESGPGGEQPALQQLVLGLLAPPDPSKASGYLERVSISEAALTLDDQMLELSLKTFRAKVEVARGERGITAEFEVPFLADNRQAEIRGRVRIISTPDDGGQTMDTAGIAPGFESADVRVEFKNIVPARFATNSPLLDQLAALNLPMAGVVEAQLRKSFDGDGGLLEIGRVRFDLEGGRGRLMVPEMGPQGIEVSEAKLEGEARQQLSFFKIDLHNVYLKLDEANISASAEIKTGFRLLPSKPEAWIRVVARRFGVSDIDRLWPTAVRPELRDWVRGHVTAGRAEETTIEVLGKLTEKNGFEPDFDSLKMETVFSGVSGQAANGMRLSGVNGRARFGPQQLDVNVWDATARWARGDLPPISGIKARAKIVPQREATVIINEARFGGLNLTASPIHVRRLDQAVPQIDGEAFLTGDLSTMLGMLKKNDMHGARELDVDPATVKGTVGMRARFQFDMSPNLTLDKVLPNSTATMTIKDFEIPKGPMGLSLDGAELKLVYDARDIRTDGPQTFRLNGAPMAIDLKHSMEAKGDGTTFIHLAGSLNDAERKALGLDTAKFVAGPVDFAVDMTRPDAVTTIANARIKLDRARVKLAQLYWEKDRNVAGALDLSLLMRRGQPVEVKEFEMSGGGMNAKGRAWLIGGKSDLRKIEFDRLAFGGRNGSDVKAVVTRREAGGWDVVLEGPQLNLQPYVEDPELLLDFPMGVKTRVQRLRLDDRRMLHNVRLDADFGGEYWNTIDLVSQLGDDGDLKVLYTPVGGDLRDLYIYASDAGMALQLMTEAQVARDLRGGRLGIKATRNPTQPNAPMDGEVRLENFTLRDSPTGEKILASATGFGPFELMSNVDLDFERLEVNFRKAGERIDLHNLYMISPGLGVYAKGQFDLGASTIDVAGYVSPFRGICELLNDRPWVGAFLVSTDKQGLIAVDVQATGSFSAPDFIVSEKPRSLPRGEMRDFARLSNACGKIKDLSPESRLRAVGSTR